MSAIKDLRPTLVAIRKQRPLARLPLMWRKRRRTDGVQSGPTCPSMSSGAPSQVPPERRPALAGSEGENEHEDPARILDSCRERERDVGAEEPDRQSHPADPAVVVDWIVHCDYDAARVLADQGVLLIPNPPARAGIDRRYQGPTGVKDRVEDLAPIVGAAAASASGAAAASALATGKPGHVAACASTSCQGSCASRRCDPSGASTRRSKRPADDVNRHGLRRTSASRTTWPTSHLDRSPMRRSPRRLCPLSPLLGDGVSPG
jgi:hypothetical protein